MGTEKHHISILSLLVHQLSNIYVTPLTIFSSMRATEEEQLFLSRSKVKHGTWRPPINQGELYVFTAARDIASSLGIRAAEADLYSDNMAAISAESRRYSGSFHLNERLNQPSHFQQSEDHGDVRQYFRNIRYISSATNPSDLPSRFPELF